MAVTVLTAHYFSSLESRSSGAWLVGKSTIEVVWLGFAVLTMAVSRLLPV
jgi:hypothetical protein